MYTLTVDDRQLIVIMIQNILQHLDPGGTHLGANRGEDALKLADENPIDVAFLDIQMPGMSGLELAKKLQERYPLVNIVFITGYKDYMESAFELYASSYIVKPVTSEAIQGALSHLRYRREEIHGKPITVSCFGSFEVFYDGKPMRFSRSKTKELFAYLVDQHGTTCTNDMIMGNLWPDKPITDTNKSMLRTLISDLRSSFEAIGEPDIIIRNKNGIAVDVSRIDCDYYKYLSGDPVAVHQFKGDYMSQYEFAENTRADLQMRMMDE